MFLSCPSQVYDVKVGDVVQVLKDETKAILLQRNHGGWNDDMKKVRILERFLNLEFSYNIYQYV